MTPAWLSPHHPSSCHTQIGPIVAHLALRWLVFLLTKVFIWTGPSVLSVSLDLLKAIGFVSVSVACALGDGGGHWAVLSVQRTRLSPLMAMHCSRQLLPGNISPPLFSYINLSYCWTVNGCQREMVAHVLCYWTKHWNGASVGFYARHLTFYHIDSPLVQFW